MNLLQSAGGSPREVATAINQLASGRSNAVFRVTLTPSSTTTTFTNANINENAGILLEPLTANAAAAKYTAPYVIPSISRISGTITVTLTHASTATTDRTFTLVALGG